VLKLSPQHQTLWQVYKTNQNIQSQLQNLKNENYIKIQYEDFCKTPESLLIQISKKLDLKYSEKEKIGLTKIKFSSSRQSYLSKNDWNKIKSEIENYL
jgi:hypothetical protein